jgi:tRNA-Thr(GGU) m(6)t(6)A37 methyltransferase TsaA
MKQSDETQPTTFAMTPIGRARTPFSDVAQIPKGPGAEHHAEGSLELWPDFEQGLQDVEGFSRLIVIWVFHRSSGQELLARTPLDEEHPHGVFATRSPHRPNPIGLTLVELLGRDGPRLRVRGLDMLDGTPILDIKPYLSGVPPEKLRRGWIAEAEARSNKARGSTSKKP